MKKIEWTKKQCKELALKYDRRIRFKTNHSSAYRHAYLNGFLDEICSHMTFKKVDRFWTKDKCAAAALKHKTKVEFDKKCRGASSSARQQGFYEEITSHMNADNSHMHRYVYALILDKTIYIGISTDPKKRFNRHKSTGRKIIKQLIKDDACLHVLSDKLNIEDAAKLEAETIVKYKNDGWNVLNIVAGGAIGAGQNKWTNESLQSVVNKCKSRSEFAIKYNGAYDASRRLGLLEDLFKNHKPAKHKKQTKHSLDELQQIANQCAERRIMNREYPHQYNSALTRGLLDQLFINHKNKGLVKI